MCRDVRHERLEWEPASATSAIHLQPAIGGVVSCTLAQPAYVVTDISSVPNIHGCDHIRYRSYDIRYVLVVLTVTMCLVV